MRPPKIYRISDAAKLLGVSKRTIFRYEKSGAFPLPRRNPINGWREYAKKDIDILKKIMGW
ncbi:MAG: MerR family transcriptional regulator [Candidatus Omnitrophica bacterium]|nr:MerR family transcriptional regulator [Candidatus Omnitrophota bacterium]